MKYLFIIASFILSPHCFGQKQTPGKASVDTSVYDFDEIFSELDFLLDSISAPKSFAVVNLGIGSAFFNYQPRVNDTVRVRNKLVYSPSVSYFHKTGFGVTASADMMNDGEKLNLYQYSLTGSYDYLKNRNFTAGGSFSRYLPKKDLPFYTSPLKSDAMVYFTYRKFDLKPSISLHYGWGSQKSYTEQKERIKNIRTTRTITTVNNVADFNISTSLRYQFLWANTFSRKDYLKFTPQVSLVSGTQQFGFNRVTNITSTRNNAGKSTTFSTENLVLKENLAFQPLSLTTLLRTEYAKDRFFVQPQLAFDYYFPASTNNLTVSFLLNVGYTFY